MFRKQMKGKFYPTIKFKSDICPRTTCLISECKYKHLEFIPPEVLIKETENIFISILGFLETFFAKPLQKMIFSYTDFSEVVMIPNFFGTHFGPRQSGNGSVGVQSRLELTQVSSDFRIFPYNSVFYLGGEIKRKLQFIINHSPHLNEFGFPLFDRWKNGTCICKSCKCKIDVYLKEHFGFTRESEYCRDCSVICSINETKICRKYTCRLCKRNKCECEMNKEKVISTKNKLKHCKECVKLWNEHH